MKMIQLQHRFLQISTTLLVLIISVALLAICDRPTGGRRLASDSASADEHGFKSNCGSGDQVSQMVGKCLVPIFEIVEGKFAEPKVDEDFLKECNRFNSTEKCLRQISKDCLSGVHKTSTSSIASATKRLRTSECKNAETRARYREPLKCAIKKGKEMEALYKNFTAITQKIRDLPDLQPEEKMMKVCCLMNLLDKSLEQSYNRDCPASTSSIMNIMRSMTDDARNTLCRGAKCDNALNKLVPSQLKQKQNFIEPIMQVLFMISVD